MLFIVAQLSQGAYSIKKPLSLTACLEKSLNLYI